MSQPNDVEISLAYEECSRTDRVTNEARRLGADFSYRRMFEAGMRKGYALRVPQIETLIAKKRELEALVYVPGLWKCSKCQFSLVQRTLCAATGGVYVNDKEGETCPNCGTTLERITEREAGNDMVDRCSTLQKNVVGLQMELDMYKNWQTMNDTEYTAHLRRDNEKLRLIWEHASDLMMAEKNADFAKECGGVAKVRKDLREAIDDYEHKVDYSAEATATRMSNVVDINTAKKATDFVHVDSFEMRTVSICYEPMPLLNPEIIKLENDIMNDQTKITIDYIESNILKEYYFTADAGVEHEADAGRVVRDIHPSLKLHTFCVLVMSSGSTITGESCCAEPKNFDAARGRFAARNRAITKAFELEGYALAQKRKATAQ